MDKTGQHMEQPTMQEADILKEEVELLKKEVDILKKANLGVVLTPEQEKLMTRSTWACLVTILIVIAATLVPSVIAVNLSQMPEIKDLFAEWMIFLPMFIPAITLTAIFRVKKHRAFEREMIEAGLTPELRKAWARAQPNGTDDDYPHSFKYHNPSYPTYRSHVD